MCCLERISRDSLERGAKNTLRVKGRRQKRVPSKRAPPKSTTFFYAAFQGNKKAQPIIHTSWRRIAQIVEKTNYYKLTHVALLSANGLGGWLVGPQAILTIQQPNYKKNYKNISFYHSFASFKHYLYIVKINGLLKYCWIKKRFFKQQNVYIL